MKIRAILAGIALGIATLAIAPHIHTHARSVGPIPLCPPENPNCGAN